MRTSTIVPTIRIKNDMPQSGPATRPTAGSPPVPRGDGIAHSAGAHRPTLRDVARASEPVALVPPDTRRRSALVGALLTHVPPADRAAAKTAIPAILDAARARGSSDPNRIGYLLATAQTESDFGAHMTETGHSAAWYNRTYGSEDGNRPGTSDGFAYRGRGYVQTTHAGRYAELSYHLGLADVPARDHDPSTVDRAGLVPALVAHPERLCEPALAAKALVVGIEENLFTHNAKAALNATIPTGRRPGDVDFYHARGIVNGIVKDQAQTIARHATAYAEILASYRHSVLGVPAAK